MASAIALGNEPLEAPRDPFAGPDEGIRLSDYARAVVSGGYGVIKDIAGAGQYVTGEGEQGVTASARRWAEEGSQGQLEQSSSAAQRYLSAKWLPGGEGPTIWDKDVSIPHALGLQVASSLPSLAASLIPGGVVARVAKAAGAGVAAAGAYGTAAGGAAGGVLTGGDLFVDIQNDILKMPDQQLQKESDIYRGLRGMGMAEDDAKQQVVSSAAGLKPVYMAAITAFTSKYGVEGMLAKRVAEKGTAAAGQGVVKGILHGAAGEGSQEFIENASQELLTQKGAIDIRGVGQYDWHKALEEAVQGAVVGAVTGGAVGAGSRHSGVTHGDVDPALDAALNPTPAASAVAPVTPEVTTPDPTVPVTVNQATVIPGQEMAGANQAVQTLGRTGAEVAHLPATPTVRATPTGLAQDEQAALSYVYDPELGENPDAGVQPDVVSAPDVPAGPPALPRVPVVASPLAEAIGAQPLPASPQPTAERAAVTAPIVETGLTEAPGQAATVAPAEVAPTPVEATPAPAVAAPAPSGRVLEGGELVERKPKKVALKERVAELQAANPELSIGDAVKQATKEQSETLVKKTRYNEPRMGKLKKAQIEAGATEVLPAKELARKQRADELAGLADRVRKAQEQFPETPTLDSPTPQLRAYARELVKAAEVGDISLNNLRADADPALRVIKSAVQVAKGAGNVSAVRDFIVNDLDLRKGGTAATEFAQAQTPSGVSFTETVGSSEETGQGPSKGAVDKAEEREIVDALTKRTRVANVQQIREARNLKREAQDIKRARATQAATAEEAQAVASTVGATVGQDRAGKFVVEKGRRKLTPPGKDAGTTKRETGQATAKTETEAAKALTVAREAENQDVLPSKQELPRKVWPAVDYEPGASHPIVQDKNALRQWVNSLTDEEYAKLQREGLHNFPVSIADTAEPRLNLAVWKAQLEDKPAKEIYRIIDEKRAEKPYVSASDDVLARRPEDDAAARELNKVLGEPRHETTTLGQILTPGKWHEDLTGLPRLLAVEMAGRLRKLAKDVPVHIVDTQRFMREWQKIHPGDERGMPEAFYNITTDEIIVRFDMLNPRVVIHEGTHAAYHRAIEDDPKVRAEIKKLMAAAERQYVEEQRRNGETGDIKLPYAFDNEHEFVAEAFSNEKIQELLHRTPATEIATQMPRGFTGWAQLIRNIKATLFGKGGPSESVLSQIVAVTARIDEAAARTRGGGPMLALASRPSGSRIVNVQNYVQNLAQDKAEGGRMWWRNLGLKGGTMDQIVSQFRGYFPSANGDPLERLLTSMRLQDTFVRNKEAEGHPHVQAWSEYAQKSPERATQLARFATNTTMANINPEPGGDNSHLGKKSKRNYQARAQLARAQAEFATFTAEEKKLLLDTSKYFRDAQNERVQAHIATILNAHDATLSPQAYAQITRNTMDGTLSEADAAIIDNDAVFKYLRDATGLNRIEGMYYPLLRHGDKIVRTLDHLGDTHGGKVVETDKQGNVTVEWRGPDTGEKVVDAAYKKFSESNNNRITSWRIVRYMNGKPVPETDARGHPHEIAYQARVQLRGFHAFDSTRQARAFIRDEAPSYADYDHLPLSKMKMERGGELTNQHAQMLISSINKRTDITESDKQLLIGTIKETAAVSLSGNRIQQRALPRRNIVGSSLDIPRNIAQYASASSHALGKLRFMPGIRAALNDMERVVKEQGFVHTDLEQARSAIHQEMVDRVDQNVTNPREYPQWVKDVMTLSFFDKLGSVSHSMVNGMQVGMVTGPVLGGTYGNLRAANEITRAYNDVAGLRTIGSGIWNTALAVKGLAQGTIGLDTTDVIGSIRKQMLKASDGAGLARMYAVLVEHGLTSTDAGLEIAGSIAAGRGKGGRALANVDRMFRQLPNAIEAINRAVTATAAWRLGRSVGMTEEQATAHALDIVAKTQGDYRVFNQPRYFNKPWLAPALQFKKYAQLMTALMVDMVHRARFETGRERRAAWKQIANLLGVQIAMAGAMSLPGLELVKVGFMLAGMLGVGDGWDDQERKLRRLFDASLGKTWGELVTKGVISRAINVDLSSRLSMSDMWTFGQPKSFESDQIKAYLANLILGAPGGLMVEWAEAARHAGNLEFQDALIKAIPAKFIADTAKAVKGVTSQGKPISNVEAAMQVVGLRSGRLAEEGEQIGAKIDVSKKLEADRKQLGRDYTEASSQGELLRIKSRIIAHNARAKETGNMRQMVYLKSLDRVRTENADKRRRIRGD